jgi:rfaE bifunctional protein nucleotidyltransferase chain/domain
VQSFTSTDRKLYGIQEVRGLSRHHREAGYTVGLTNGCFDILHIGHLSVLERARSMCNFLIVGVNSDRSVRLLKGPGRPINAEADRARMVAGLECVSAVVIFDDTTADELIATAMPSCYFKGGDYNPDNLPEYRTLQRLGVSPVFLSLEPGKSTTSVIDRIVDVKRHTPMT